MLKKNKGYFVFCFYKRTRGRLVIGKYFKIFLEKGSHIWFYYEKMQKKNNNKVIKKFQLSICLSELVEHSKFKTVGHPGRGGVPGLSLSEDS